MTLRVLGIDPGLTRCGIGIVDVAATVLEGADYDAGWAAFTTASPAFDGYRAKAGDRLIPVVKLTRQP